MILKWLQCWNINKISAPLTDYRYWEAIGRKQNIRRKIDGLGGLDRKYSRSDIRLPRRLQTSSYYTDRRTVEKPLFACSSPAPIWPSSNEMVFGHTYTHNLCITYTNPLTENTLCYEAIQQGPYLVEIVDFCSLNSSEHNCRLLFCITTRKTKSDWGGWCVCVCGGGGDNDVELYWCFNFFHPCGNKLNNFGR